MSRQVTGRRSLEAIRDSLSERDSAVLASVARYRLLGARHIERLHFADHATPLAGARICRRVLERLHELRVLTRLERRVGGVRAGSASYVYAVGPVGARLIYGDGGRRRQLEPGERYVRHTLAMSGIAVDLIAAARPGAFEVLSVSPEPECWRSFTGGHGSVETLKPDLHVVTATAAHEFHWFVEVDLATESAAAVVRKCRTYEAYWRSGHEEARAGLFPSVVWLVPTERRQASLRAAIQASGVEQGLFSVSLIDDATAVLAGGGAS